MKISIIKNNQKWILVLVAAVFWTSLWYFAALALGNELFLPYPHTVLVSLFRLLGEGYFWRSVLRTLFTVATGCLLGCLFGNIFAITAALSVTLEAIISPLITVFRTTPVASFIILVYVIVRLNNISVGAVSLIIVVLMVIPIVYNNTRTGIAEFDRDLGEVAQVYHFSFWKKIFVLWLPQLKPYLNASLINALGFAWKAGVAAEVICNLKDTVGKHLADSKSNLEMDRLFAWTITVIFFSMIFEVILKRIFRSPVSQAASREKVSG